MYMTMCRHCAGKLMDTYLVTEVEGTQTVGQCEKCRYLSPGDKPVRQYEVTPRRKWLPKPPTPASKKDSRAQYKEPFRENF